LNGHFEEHKTRATKLVEANKQTKKKEDQEKFKKLA